MGPREQGNAAGEQHTDQMDEQEAREREIRAKWESLRSGFNEWAVTHGEPLSTFDEIVDGQVRHERVEYQKERASSELEDSSVVWDQVTSEDAAALQELLDCNPHEPEMHRFLEDHPQFLIQVLGAGHGRYQLSKPRFGAELIPDFLIAEMSSIGIQWHAVEIESPRSKAHRRDGLPNSKLNHAIGQICDWRQWLMNNIDYARRPKEQTGLGLVGIDPRVTGLILIGRRLESNDRYNEFRRQRIDRERIVIHSYDWLVDIARSNESGRLAGDLWRRSN